MNRTWCYSCGAPAVGGRSKLAPLCERCAQSGRQVPRDRLRWMLRTTDGGSRGPLSHDAVVDQLGRDALGPDDRVARVGGDWSRLCEHPDFRRYFLPGSADAERLQGQKNTDRKEKGAYVSRRRARFTGAALFAAASVGLAVFSSQSGLLVIPEPIVDRAKGLFQGASDGIGDQINAATNKEIALENARQKQVLPGEPMVAAVQARWPDVQGPAALHLTRGRIALWKGTTQANDEARAHFEQALALIPDDPEANAGLARAAARRIYIDSGLTDLASQAAARASALAPESPAALLARAEVALATGGRDLALDLVTRCGDPPDIAGMKGATVDLDCAVAVSSLGHRANALEVLDRRFPGIYPIRLARAEAALAVDDLALARQIAGELTRDYPGEGEPWRVQMAAAMTSGSWEAAYEAGNKLRRIDPNRLDERRELAELDLKVRGRAKDALAEYEAILEHPNLERLPDRAQLLTDAAAAATHSGNAARGLALADQALALDSGSPAAVVQRAHALLGLNKPEAAQAALRDVDLNRVTGHRGARFHVAAASIFIQVGLAKQAVTELRSALDADPNWPPVHLVSAQSKLLVGNLGGAIEDIERVAFLDFQQDELRSPLQPLWYPPSNWRQLRSEYDRQLMGEARFAARGPAAAAVLAAYAHQPDADRLMAKALEAGSEAPAALAAKAQLLLARGAYSEAYRYAELVLSSGQDLTLLYALKGRCLVEMGRVPEGTSEFKKATDEPHQVSAVHRLMAEARRKQGDSQGAREQYKEVLRLVPDDIGARRALLGLREGGG